MELFKRLYRFIRYNGNKKMSFLAFFYSARFRWQILHVEPKKLHTKWGIQGEESPWEDTKENLKYAARVSYVVNRICQRTSWESKCLVRALTAQKLLKKKGIASTMYLGCGMDADKMVAHAWLRCGQFYVTGGDGAGYAVVDKYRV